MQSQILICLTGFLSGAVIGQLFRRTPLPWLADYAATDLSEALLARSSFRFWPGGLGLSLFDALIFYAIFHETFSVTGLITLYLTQVLLLISVADFKTLIIPDQYILALLPGGLLLWLTDVLKEPTGWFKDLAGRLIAGLAAGLLLFVVGWLAAKLRHKEAMGGGDIKLLAACAFLSGLNNLIALFLLSFLLASIQAIALVFLNKFKTAAKSRMAFGPYIAFATVILLLFQPAVQNLWLSYLELFAYR